MLPARPADISPYLWMLGGAASFSVMSFLTGIARHSCDWQYIAITRTGVALFLALYLTYSAGARFVFLRPGKLWMRSIAGSLSLVANFYAMTHLPVSDVLTVTNIFPLWVALLSWPLLGTKPANDTWIAAVIGVIGVAIVQQPHFTDGGIALAACVLSSFTSAVALIGLHQLKGIDPRAVVAHFSGVSLVFCSAALFFPLERGGGIPAEPVTWLLLGTLAIAATVGQIMLTKAFAAGPPARVSVVNLSQVAMAALMEVVFLGRSFSAWHLIGMALVLAPTAWVLLRRLPAVEVAGEKLPLADDPRPDGACSDEEPPVALSQPPEH